MRIRLLIEYDGTDFGGWQVQPGVRTVQGELEAALARFVGAPVAIMGSGRTDAGVHARGQVAHADVPDTTDLARLLRGLAALAGRDVAVTHIAPAAADFHARYDARRRVYHYQASTAPRALDRRTRLELRPAPDFDAMNAAARAFVGRHHFGAFCRTQSGTRNRVCTVETALWEPESRPGDWRFRVEANRFLHGMVRAFVGTLLLIGWGKLPAEALPEMIATQDRRHAGPAAPAHGLVLERVDYAAALAG